MFIVPKGVDYVSMYYSILQSQHRFMKNQSQIYDVPQLCTESSGDIPSDGSELVVSTDLEQSNNPSATLPHTELIVFTEVTDIQASNSVCSLTQQVNHFIFVYLC